MEQQRVAFEARSREEQPPAEIAAAGLPAGEAPPDADEIGELALATSEAE